VRTLYRYVRAFLVALKMTLQGRKLPEGPQHPLVIWIEHLAVLTDEVYKTADKTGLDKNARVATKLRLDGRLISMETVLAAVKFHAAQEYPSLIRSGLTQQVLNAIYASNVNDLYRITRVAELETPDNPAFVAAVMRLKSQLAEFPPTDRFTH
jgi:hypothetical protein